MPQQVPRLAVVFGLALAGLFGARRLLVPKTFGEIGHYRAAAVDSIRAHPKKYAGHEQCRMCHRSIAEQRLSSNHRGVACEVCHGPAAEHVAGPMATKPPAPRKRGFCPLCHDYNPSRPTGFAQIDRVAHSPGKPCITCHDPHAPEPPIVPEECSACHGQIARQKAVSHHAILTCQTCHAAPEAHKTTPKTARPTKPADRSFCGTCHAQAELEKQGIPQVALGTHGGDHFCWQCHYPHNPEAHWR